MQKRARSVLFCCLAVILVQPAAALYDLDADPGQKSELSIWKAELANRLIHELRIRYARGPENEAEQGSPQQGDGRAIEGSWIYPLTEQETGFLS